MHIFTCHSHTNSYRYLHAASVIGNGHITTLDGSSFNFGGYGEYVLLRTKPSVAVEQPIMLQMRTDFVAHQAFSPDKAVGVRLVLHISWEKNTLTNEVLVQWNLS